MARNGFTMIVNTSLRSDGTPIFKEVSSDAVGLAETMGWRKYDGSKQPSEARAFDPAAARAKEDASIAKLQERIDRMLELGYKPDIKAIRLLSDVEFDEQMAELKRLSESEHEKEQEQPQQKQKGRKAGVPS